MNGSFILGILTLTFLTVSVLKIKMLDKVAMENQLGKITSLETDSKLSPGVVHDLNHFLSDIKGRTVLMMKSVNLSHPLQDQFNEIINRIDESIEATEVLSNHSKSDQGLQK